MINITDDFLGRVVEFSKEVFPEETIHRAKLALLDYIAVSTAGSHAIKEKIDSYIDSNLIPNGEYKLISRNITLSLNDAVFLNGLQGHALDYDDGTNAGIIHLGSPIFSVLLHLAKKYKIEDMGRFYRAAIIGYEASFTIANAIQPKHKSLGYHATGTCGILGTIIASSYLLGYDYQTMRRAFSIGALSSTGMLKVLDDKSELKPYNVAKTAILSLISLQFSMAGFVEPEDALGGERGFFKLMYGSNDVIFPNMKLNGTYAIDKAYIKPFAACRYCHPSIDAAITLSNDYGLNSTNIKSINVKTYETAVNGHNHTIIPNAASGKMSIPYSVAVGIREKKAGLNEFTDKIVKEEELIELTGKVKVEADPTLSKLFPVLSAAEVCIEDFSGNKYSKRVDYAKGEPENPLSEEEFLQRYIDMYIFAGKTEEKAIYDYETILDSNTTLSDIYGLL